MMASKPFCVTIAPSNRHLLDAWVRDTICEDTVWPYLSFDRYTPAFIVDDSDWGRVIQMDAGGTAVLRLTIDRESGAVGNVSLWALPGRGQQRAVANLARQLPGLCRRYGLRFLDAACHESNHRCRRLLTKRFGSPWGIKPLGAWNGMTGKFEDSLHFRLIVGEQL